MHTYHSMNYNLREILASNRMAKYTSQWTRNRRARNEWKRGTEQIGLKRTEARRLERGKNATWTVADVSPPVTQVQPSELTLQWQSCMLLFSSQGIFFTCHTTWAQ